ncbi:hypothetical protein Pla100_54760 [Neorhodopirellula pilleata]|uniref:Uncharacterized protein n=1 Tax=Neorhodopirellula pilleata TaxID=2714738 RepID=A0A5C5ZRK9_9BACT|nr:hypothetical protein Pla100_54760 [Neorhodopirellula pilleata]
MALHRSLRFKRLVDNAEHAEAQRFANSGPMPATSRGGPLRLGELCVSISSTRNSASFELPYNLAKNRCRVKFVLRYRTLTHQSSDLRTFSNLKLHRYVHPHCDSLSSMPTTHESSSAGDSFAGQMCILRGDASTLRDRFDFAANRPTIGGASSQPRHETFRLVRRRTGPLPSEQIPNANSRLHMARPAIAGSSFERAVSLPFRPGCPGEFIEIQKRNSCLGLGHRRRDASIAYPVLRFAGHVFEDADRRGQACSDCRDA